MSLPAQSSAPASDPPSIPAALLSLRVLLLKHISDLEARAASFAADPSAPKHAQEWEIQIDVSEPDPDNARSPSDVMQDMLALLDSVRNDVRRHLPDIDIDFPSFPDFDLSHIHVPDALLARLRACSPSLSPAFVRSLSIRLQQLSALAAPPAPLTRLLSFFDSIPLADLDDSKHALEGSTPESRTSENAPLIPGRLPTPAETLLRAADGTRLIYFSDLPFKWRNNQFVLTGYRFIPVSNWPALVLSPVTWHNETINILSHLLPTILFPLASVLPIPVVALPTPYWPSWLSPPEVILDPLPRFYFFFAAAFCLACSVIWHVLNGCSHLHVCEWAARVDYVGIGWLISASITSAIYYGFYCNPRLAAFYASFSILTGLLGSILPFQAWFNERKNKKWRIAFFVACAMSALVFFVHLSIIRGFDATLDFYSPIIPSIFAYTFGLFFYGFHFPECAFPGRFDYIGASHQIWHICIVIAIWLHYRAIASWHVGADAYACSALDDPGLSGRALSLFGW